MTDTKTVEAVPPAALPDIEKIAATLFAADESKAKKDARDALKKIPGTWDFLPVRLRSAIRSDIGRMVSQGKGLAEIVAAGYSNVTAERALRDLGHRV